MSGKYYFDDKRFEETASKLIEAIKEQPEQLTTELSFKSGYLFYAEGYKYGVYENGRRELDFDNWDKSLIGTGVILHAVLRAFGVKGNNLISYYTDKFRSDAERDLKNAETVLFDVYRGNDDESAFKALSEVFGRDYNKTAFLFFLKDRERYLPVKPELFKEAFEELGITTEATEGCSWEHYREFIRIIKVIREKIRPFFKGEVTLLDAHSFAWCVHLLKDEIKNKSGKLTQRAFEKKDRYVVLNDLQIKLAEQLLISVRDGNEPLTYGELAERVTPKMNPRNVGKNIGKISALCHQLGLPLISAKVVYGKQGVAGDGFYELYEQLGIPTNGKSIKELNYEERKAIGKCKEWYRLEDFLGLKVGLPRPEIKIKPVDEETKLAELIADEVLMHQLYGEQQTEREEVGYSDVPKEKPALVEISGRSVYLRNKATANNALTKADCKCEVNSDHPTFLRKNSERRYTEAHHLVPMAYQDSFSVSLDCEQNIVSLCCNCHRQIHFGAGAEKLISVLFDKREEALRDAGINITKEQLFSLYDGL